MPPCCPGRVACELLHNSYCQSTILPSFDNPAGRRATKASLVNRSLDCSPERFNAAGDHRRNWQKSLIARGYLAQPRKAVQLLQ
jgi:hypothetical protein